MYRTLLCKRSWPGSRPSVRRFHSTPCHRVDSPGRQLITELGSETVAFHDFFQHVHDYTALPWLFSIPIATILVRSILTPVRIYFAHRRQAQRLAIPRLELASTVIEKQNELRVAAGVQNTERSDAWKKGEWMRWRAEIEKLYPGAKPSGFISPETNFDATNWGAMAIVAVNTSTIWSLAARNPDLIGIVGVEAWGVYMSGVFVALAISNTYYYQRKSAPEAQPVQQLPEPMWSSIFQRSDLVCIYMPVMAGFTLSAMPGPVILSVLSNSAYTFIERHAIQLFTRTPSRVDRWPRAAVQTMRVSKKTGSDNTKPATI